MRTQFLKSMLLSMVLLMSAGGIMRTAEAAQLNLCASVNNIYFIKGVTTTPQDQDIKVKSIFASCAQVGIGAVPVEFVWDGRSMGASCLSALNQVGPGSGILTWDDRSTSTVTLTNVTLLGLVGITPAVATFKIQSGHGKNGSFTVAAEFLQSANNLTSCLTGTPVYYVAGPSSNNFIGL